MSNPLWQPADRAQKEANLARFMAWAGDRHGRDFVDCEALHAWSVADTAAFWEAVWDFTGVVGDKGAGPFLVDAAKMPGARFFPNARLNFAENLFRHGGEADALVFWGEDKVKRRMGWGELNRQAARFQGLLAEHAVDQGARVAAIMPNMPEAVSAMLGAAASGCIWSSCSPDFGVKGVLDRFGQIEPEVLVACDAYVYNGKIFPMGAKLGEIVAALPSLKLVVIVPYMGEAVPGGDGELAGLDKAVHWGRAVDARGEEVPTFRRLEFSHPLYILFSSGTTGVPKCIVHSAGGTLLQHKKEHVLHCDLRQGDRLFYFSTCGWMMWNWLVSGLASGATLLLFDGSPFAPGPNILFDYADAERMTFFGTSAKYIDSLKKAEVRPAATHDLSSVRAIASTGSPLVAESFDYVYEAIKRDVHLASVSGGTDIVSCFVIGNPLKPVWRGEIQGPGLGMDIDVVDEEARHMARGKGELVCRNAFPSMPIGFWGDPDGAKYRAAYFERFPGLWHHGDFAEWTEHGGMIIHGRSDATLNPGGVRIGTAEIYRQVEQLGEIVEAIVIGQDWDGDVRVVLFVRLAEGVSLDADLERRIRQRIRDGASPRHVPSKIVAVRDIPRTKSGKITELAVRDIVHGKEIKNREALANPEALELFRDIPELGRP
ncbi:MAG: acetoacetate--CoA ligase [Rhizobiales bacterium]|nr:acetoacetate--CoA ligase [Hyphomicrobiales bacterium]